MTARTLVLGWILTSALLGQETSPPVPVPEPPAPAGRIDQERVISHTQQFQVYGGEPKQRGIIATLAEEAKDELLRLTEEQDTWKVPISIRLHGKLGDPIPKRSMAMEILVSEVGYQIRLELHLAEGITPEKIKYEITSALALERTLRAMPTHESDTPLLVPPWLIDGLLEASDWRLNQSDRKLYGALFKSGNLFKLDELFALNEQEFWEMDGASRAAFHVSAGALVMALLEQPQGKQGFKKFLADVGSYGGEMPSLLRKHFPELNLSETSLSKWWALKLASIGGKNLATEVLTISNTESALTEALRLNFQTAEGIIEQKEFTAWPELAALTVAERAKSVQAAQDAIARLSYRCFPSYRPILAEYQLILRAIAANKTKDLPAQIAALSERRGVMLAKANRARDYLDWFEITRARKTSGAFDDYIRLKERLKENPHRRNDDISKYLDRMDAIFNRGQDRTKPPSNVPQVESNEPTDLPPLSR
jgi:hypothetical protein